MTRLSKTRKPTLKLEGDGFDCDIAPSGDGEDRFAVTIRSKAALEFGQSAALLYVYDDQQAVLATVPLSIETCSTTLTVPSSISLGAGEPSKMAIVKRLDGKPLGRLTGAEGDDGFVVVEVTTQGGGARPTTFRTLKISASPGAGGAGQASIRLRFADLDEPAVVRVEKHANIKS